MSAPKLLVPMTWQQFDEYTYVFCCPECSLYKSARSMEALEKQLSPAGGKAKR